MKQNYLKAISILLRAGMPVEQVLSNFKQLLNKRGHQALYGVVLHSLVVNFESGNNQGIPLVVVANANDVKSELVKNALLKLQADTENFTTEIDESIIGGAVISYQHQMIDQSYKTKLKNLYQSVITK
ncbi:MAG: hypothetical protein COY98_00620 [Candidatus Yonathbacteria bacterium CG_4_10_14_0_8_um_filter_43_17]|uniref:Uncharacterized protein n=1 Tax=Candidatus Yonathbacteria bacterium CG_4_10_14_0_8_um_filter_43_17 TaxID=1975099 RepID=A0A2M7Q680_9BACT|nr:MAG: hypothetical protein COY98_00620 [Candidatus Yonathbacteria bacterium CG_4_10_14_0_8_um_filter_43_17]